MSDAMTRIELIQKHPDTVGCVNFHHKQGEGRSGPRKCSTYVFSINKWVYGEGDTAEQAFLDMWRQLIGIIPDLADGRTPTPAVQTAPPGLTRSALPPGF